MRPLRILQLVKYFPPVIGGVEAVSKDLSEAFAEMGIRADVLCANQGMRTIVESNRSFSVFRNAGFGRLLSTPLSPTLPFALKRCLKSGYDLIHLHHPDPFGTLALYLIRPPVPIVLHWHSDIVRQVRTMRLFGRLQEWLLRAAVSIVAASPNYFASSNYLQAYRTKASVIPYGIDVARLRADPVLVEHIRRSLGNRKLVVSVGRLVYYKGFEYLIGAVASLPEEYGLLICGDGPLKGELQKAITKLRVGKRIRIDSGVSNEQLGSYYSAADVFCLSSVERSEAFGIVQLEAMTFGKPIIATNIPGSGVPWVNVDGVTGINVEPKSSAALAEAIRAILDNPSAAIQMGQNAKMRVLQHFTRAGMASKFKSLYEQIVR